MGVEDDVKDQYISMLKQAKVIIPQNQKDKYTVKQLEQLWERNKGRK